MGGTGGTGGGGEPQDTASIVVTTSDGPAVGADVVFHDAAGIPTAHVTTDAAGRATAEVAPGGMITILLLDGERRYRATFAGVEANDELAFASPRQLPSEPIGNALVAIPTFPGAAVYRLEFGCGIIVTNDVSVPIAADIHTRCVSPDGTFHLLATALNASQGSLAYSYRRNILWEVPMVVVMPSFSEDLASYTFVGTNAPDGAVAAVMQVAFETNQLSFSSWGATPPLESGGNAGATFAYAPGFADVVESLIGVQFGTKIDVTGLSYVVQRSESPSASLSLDLSADLLPRVSQPSYDTTEPRRPALSWTAPLDLGKSDGAVARFAWSESGGFAEDWTCLLPPATTAPFKLPALPEALSSWAPSASVTYRPGTIQFFDPDWVTSYRELRRNIGFTLLGPTSALPVVSAVRVSEASSPVE
jgi:hypothetical protein